MAKKKYSKDIAKLAAAILYIAAGALYTFTVIPDSSLNADEYTVYEAGDDSVTSALDDRTAETEEAASAGSGERTSESSDMSEVTPSLPVNINTADAEELEQLPGIGPSKAEAIIAYRESVGAFAGIEDIMLVPGIKEGVFNRIKDSITV